MKWTRYCIRAIEIVALLAIGPLATGAQNESPSRPLDSPSATEHPLTEPADLGPVAAAINAVMEPVATAHGRLWVGINPAEKPAGSQLGIFVIDSTRVVGAGCRGFALECRIGMAAQGTCVAMDDRTIACDSRFLLAVLNLAVHAADESTFDGLTVAQKNEGFRKFLADNRAIDMSGPMSRGKLLTRRLAVAPDTYREVFESYLTGALNMILVHEFGHIQLGHLRAGQLNGSHPNDWSTEYAADQFALDWIAQKQPAEVLARAPEVLADLQSYSLDAASAKVGFADFTVFQSDIDVSGESQASLKAALMRIGLCDSTHPSVGARIGAMTKSKSFDAARSRWLVTFSARVSESTHWVEPFCQQTESAKRIETSGEVVTAIKVAVLKSGSGTPSKLRYHWTRDTEQNLSMTSHNTLLSQLEDLPPRSNESRAMTEAAARVIEGDRAPFKVALQPGLPGSTMVSMVIKFDDRGAGLYRQVFTKESSDDHWSEDNGIAGRLVGLSDLSVHTIVLPDEPIGVGGTWSIRSDQRVGYSETLWTLVRRDGDRLTLSGTMVTTSRPDKEGREGGGAVTAVIDLRRPAPVRYTCRLSTTTSFVTPSGTMKETEASEFNFDDGTDGGVRVN